MASVYSDEYQIVIKALREARIARGITRGNLALDRSQSFIAKVENGERRLDIVEFIHLVLCSRAGMASPEHHRNCRNEQGQDGGNKQRAVYTVLLQQHGIRRRGQRREEKTR
ncbi:hypothetical protein PEC301296_24450 [Pectobacterium carotovorum subsp. carotovorum]|nr:putative regulatory protein [Pectobacterium atrosepticum]POW29993.1 transcriptional regulator [Pectobacterium atrosepticum]GKV86133.1 hypothetical protein PEC301296_24450 [Pectobacterium carotovorum subsp. carotovorum]